MEKSETIILYPSPGQMGHLVSMVELAKLLHHHHNLKVTILVVDTSFKSNTTSTFLTQVSSTYPFISFHYLPQVDLSHFPTPKHHESLHFEVIKLTNPNLKCYLSSLLTKPLAIVFDYFCEYALDVTKGELGIPSYVFFTSNASCLATCLYLPSIDSQTTLSLKDLGSSPIDIPGLLPVPADHMINPILDRTDQAYSSFVFFARYAVKVDGIIVNTFEWLESETIKQIKDSLYIQDTTRMPPVFCVGPLIMSDRGAKDDTKSSCMAWLDTQPKASVIFLCFGSMGAFSKQQLVEIAKGLERSEKRFLWVVRCKDGNEDDLEKLLPCGFLDRTKDFGFLVKSWAPQVEVLNHVAIGGFVTHLGWNSALEAICAGVPMIGWPLYAEQRLNRISIVDSMKLAIPMEGYKWTVSAEEVEKRVRELMEPNSSKEIRKRIQLAKEEAKTALADGGTSSIDLRKLVSSWGL